ncbi:hypothetical protein C5L31_001169 [Secundilactobacillus malefermentans]|uniref:GGDEF domain-containing protein n=1 Tax=Secundilactobacillus malefermentans TaxID=176292 RepID=A0A4R5NH89_9LACO|nr:Signal transduction diguanylate cyclase [Secundilactobacillus malefermentans DSM 5705 = KCTC 3548]TDG73905.1 hypothetical protein C5L31_001169 [Secundilactobacillus malefermentans]
MAYKDALVYRVGGEEFNMLLPNVDILEADRVARRLKNKIETTPIETNKGSINVTASLGVATLNENDKTPNDFYERADQLLYRSKGQGRNQITSEL